MTTPWSRGHGEGQGSHDAAADPVPAPSNGNPVPLGYRFDVVWRGNSRRRVELRNLRERFDRQCREPLPVDAVADRRLRDAREAAQRQLASADVTDRVPRQEPRRG